MSKQLAPDKRNVQEQMEQVSKCLMYSKCNLRAPHRGTPSYPQYTLPSSIPPIDAKGRGLVFFFTCITLRVSMHSIALQ